MSETPRPTRRAFLSAAAAGLTAASTSRGWSGPASAGPWKIGCYTRPWDKYEYRVAFDAIAEAGFKYVGLMSHKSKGKNTNWIMINAETTPEEAAEFGAQARARGLTIVSAYGMYSVAASLADGVRDLRRLVERCVDCGCPNLLLGGTTDPAQYDAYYKSIAECCDFAASKKVLLTIKPHGGQNSTGPQCRKAIERVNHQNFRLTFDPGNIYYYSEGARSPVDDAATVDGLVAAMCVKDFKPPKNVNVTPGTGRVDFKAVLDRLIRGGFTSGPLVVECLDPGEPKAVTVEAKKALGLLRELTGTTS